MRGLRQRLGRVFVTAGGVSLAVLHIAVLFRRVADGSLLKPLVVAQWLVALGLLVAIWALRRQGVSIFRGRPAAAFWIVVALMHGIVTLPTGPGVVGVLNAVQVADAMPVGVGLLAGAMVLLVGLLSVRSRSALALSGRHRTATQVIPVSWRPLVLAARGPPA